MGCSPWGREESDTTEGLHFHFSLSCIGEGNGNPLQCSCLENPRGRRAWWADVYGVTQSRTWLKWLSSSSSRVTSTNEKIELIEFSKVRCNRYAYDVVKMYRFQFYNGPLDLGLEPGNLNFFLALPSSSQTLLVPAHNILGSPSAAKWLPLSTTQASCAGQLMLPEQPLASEWKELEDEHPQSFTPWVRQVWGYILVSQNPPVGLSCPQRWPTRTHTGTQSQPIFISWVLPPRIQPTAGQKYLKRNIPESCKSKTWICCALESVYIAFI